MGMIKEVMEQAVRKQHNFAMLIGAALATLDEDLDVPSMHRAIGPYVFDDGQFYIGIKNDMFEVSMYGRPEERKDGTYKFDYSISSQPIKPQAGKTVTHASRVHYLLKDAIKMMYDAMNERMQEVDDG